MCDVGMFSSAKNSWKRAVNQWRNDNSGILNEAELIKLLKKVNDEFINPESIKNGFRATGIHPFNVENVMFDRCYGSPQALSSTVVKTEQDPTFEVTAAEQDLAFEGTATEQDPTFEGTAAEQDPVLEGTVVVSRFTSAQTIVEILNGFQEQLKNIVLPFMLDSNDEFASDLTSAVVKQVSCLKKIATSGSLASVSAAVPAVVSLVTSTNSSISDILKSPPPFKRAEKRRNYKIDQDQLKKKQEKEMKLTLKNIKKESVEKRKKEKLEKIQKKRLRQEDKDNFGCKKMRKVDLSLEHDESTELSSHCISVDGEDVDSLDRPGPS